MSTPTDAQFLTKERREAAMAAADAAGEPWPNEGTDLIPAPSTDVSKRVWEVSRELVGEDRLRLPMSLTAKQAQTERHEMKRVFARLRSYMDMLDAIIREDMETQGARQAVVRRSQPGGFSSQETTFRLRPEIVYGVIPGHEDRLLQALNALYERELITAEDLRKAGSAEIIPEQKRYSWGTPTLKKLCESYGDEVRHAIQEHWTATEVGKKLEIS